MLISNGWTTVEVPTPQVVVEAIMEAVRARGVPALKEPATLDRLSQCDAHAHAQINQRIAKLQDAGRLLQVNYA